MKEEESQHYLGNCPTILKLGCHGKTLIPVKTQLHPRHCCILYRILLYHWLIVPPLLTKCVPPVLITYSSHLTLTSTTEPAHTAKEGEQHPGTLRALFSPLLNLKLHTKHSKTLFPLSFSPEEKTGKGKIGVCDGIWSRKNILLKKQITTYILERKK